MKKAVRETFIIDGYNLVRRAFPFLEDGHGLEAARAKLEVRLREFLRVVGTGVQIVLVYDGSALSEPAPAGPPADPSLEVVFSAPPRTADESILEISRRRAGEGPITVISSDEKDVGLPARAFGLLHRTSEEFGDLLDDALSRPARAASAESEDAAKWAEKPAPEEVSAQEAEEWLRIFSEPKPSGRTSPPPGGKPDAPGRAGRGGPRGRDA